MVNMYTDETSRTCLGWFWVPRVSQCHWPACHTTGTSNPVEWLGI